MKGVRERKGQSKKGLGHKKDWGNQGLGPKRARMYMDVPPRRPGVPEAVGVLRVNPKP